MSDLYVMKSVPKNVPENSTTCKRRGTDVHAPPQPAGFMKIYASCRLMWLYCAAVTRDNVGGKLDLYFLLHEFLCCSFFMLARHSSAQHSSLDYVVMLLIKFRAQPSLIHFYFYIKVFQIRRRNAVGVKVHDWMVFAFLQTDETSITKVGLD